MVEKNLTAFCRVCGKEFLRADSIYYKHCSDKCKDYTRKKINENSAKKAKRLYSQKG